MPSGKDMAALPPGCAGSGDKNLNISIDTINTGLQVGRTAYAMRYPRLDTVLMVEGFIRKHDGEFKKKRLWEALPKRMMYQTFCVVIDYLLYSGKISVDAEGKIGWIYYPEKVKRDVEFKYLFWKRPRPGT